MVLQSLITLLLATISYTSPVSYPIELAGNFAEPRPNHFHGGIDIKTGQEEGKAVHSIGDGYVSQVTIGLFGFGNAVYVHHPEGYTSVYCHLKAFSARLQAMVRKEEYACERSQGTFRFRPGEVPVSAGDLIAWSGNTGASQAPHLHLEVHDNRTWNMHDPLQFIGRHVTDHTPPQAHGFMACPQPGRGVFGGGSGHQVFGFPSHDLSTHFTAWGKVGFAIWANDYMESTYNNYGIRKQQLYVDGKLVFQSDANDIPVQDNLQVNYWGDYQHYVRSHVWYMRSYVLPGVTLPIFKTGLSRGIVNFNQQREYHLTYILTDFAGNAARYTFTVEGRKMAIPKVKSPSGPLLRWDRFNRYALPGARLQLSHHLLAEDVYIHPQTLPQPGRLSHGYRLMAGSYPLLGFGQISIRLNKAVADPTKLYVISQWGSSHYMGGTYKNGWVTGRIRELGAIYELGYDADPPVVGPVGQGGWTAHGLITISVVDAKSGLKDFQGFVDGHFVPFDEVPKSPWVRCDLAATPVKKTGGMHQLRFVALDQRNNQRIYTTQFKY